MKAPITSNSITERVQFTGLYVPESQPATPAKIEREDAHEHTLAGVRSADADSDPVSASSAA